MALSFPFQWPICRRCAVMISRADSLPSANEACELASAHEAKFVSCRSRRSGERLFHERKREGGAGRLKERSAGVFIIGVGLMADITDTGESSQLNALIQLRIRSLMNLDQVIS